MTDVHYLQLAIKVWQLFSKDSIRMCNIEITEKSTFDCTKICVTKPVQDSIIRYYSEYQKLSDEEIGTKLLLCGPKANLIGDGYEVEVENGFVIEGE